MALFGDKRSRASIAAGSVRARIVKLIACVAIGLLLLVLALMVGDADYHATAIGWVPLLMFFTLLASARVYLGVLKKHIEFEEYVDNNSCVRDCEVPFNVRFRNRGPLFFLNVKVTFTIKDMFGNPYNTTETVLGLVPHQSYAMDFSMKFTHVGRYCAGVERIVISDFLGLFTHTIVNKNPKTVCVNPKLATIASMKFSDEALEDSDKASKSVLADSMDYAYVREYVQGDPLKTIHWKLSARTGEYMTRLFEIHTNPSVAIFMDLYAPVEGVEDLMTAYDTIIESGFSIMRYACQEGLEPSVHYINTAGDACKLTGCTAEDVARFVEDVPAMSNDRSQSGKTVNIIRKQMTRRYGQNNYIVCTANFSPELFETLVDARANGRTPLVVAVVPVSVVDRDREDYCRPLLQLESAGIDYMIISRASEMRGVVR